MDNSEMAKRVRAAAVAGWWTILIAVIYMTAAWLGFLTLLHCKPDWMLWMWGGGDLNWDQVHNIVIYFFSVFKLIMFTAVLVLLWLTLWARKLKRLG